MSDLLKFKVSALNTKTILLEWNIEPSDLLLEHLIKFKSLIEKDIKKLENKFNKKVVTYIRSFKKFYKAEEYHQDFYKIKFERYLRYKKACGREELLKRIWSK